LGIVLGIISAAPAWSQATNTFPSSGNVGIGTTTPNVLLQVQGHARFSNSPTTNARVDVYGGVDGGDTASFYIYNSAGNLNTFLSDGTYNSYMNAHGGNVGIGRTNPEDFLQVAGTIGAEQVIVSSTGADYVFDPNYHLASLSEVAAYVRQNHHLPGIPFADEMSKSGIRIGEMQTKLLAKIEELTLHMIQAEVRNTRLEEQNRELVEHDRELLDRDAKLQSRIEALEAHAQDGVKRRNEQ
jgi:hypothetical protein